MRRLKAKALIIFLLAASPLIANEDESSQNEVQDHRQRGYHFGIGLAKPIEIGNQYNHYEKLFGAGSTYPEIWGEFSFLQIGFGLDLGASFRAGFYKDKGKSVSKSGTLDLGSSDSLNQDISDSDIDGSQKSLLTMIPLQAALNLSYSPFMSRFLIFNFWSGISYTFIENTTQANLDSSVDQSDVLPYVNSGFNQEQVSGASISFDVSRIDPRASYSLKVYGISGIFLTPFIQNVSTIKNKVGVYDRQIMGLMFSFETTGT